MALTVRFSTPMTFAVLQPGQGAFASNLLTLANGSLVDMQPSVPYGPFPWTFAESLIGFDALDPLRTTTEAVPGVDTIIGHYLVTGSTIHEFYSAGGSLAMRTNAVNGMTSAPVVIDPVHSTQAFYEGSFSLPSGRFGLGDGAFVVLYGVNGGGVTGSFMQRYAVDGTAFGPAIKFSTSLANAGPGMQPQVTMIDSTHFVVNMHTVANPNVNFAQVYDLNGVATSPVVTVKHYQTADITPVGLTNGTFVEIIRGWHLGHNSLSMRIYDVTGAPVTKYIDIGTSTTFADAAAFSVTALAGGKFAVAWISYDPVVGNPNAEQIRLQIFDNLGRAQTTALIVGETDRSAEHLSMTTMADGRIAIGWDFNNTYNVEYIDARSERIAIGGTFGDDAYMGSAYDDAMNGGDGNDRLNGGDGNDSLSGGNGKDILLGGDGNDLLAGELGNDTLTGGNGADVFVFDLKGGRDTVTDFVRGQDKIDVSAYHYASATAALAAFSTGIFSDHNTFVTFTGLNTTTLTASDLIL